jgi:putative acetyltransferase
VIRRRYRADDAEATLNIFKRAIHLTAARDYSAEQFQAWAPDDLPLTRWAEAREAARSWVARADHRIVGFTDLSPTGHIGMAVRASSGHRRGAAGPARPLNGSC